MRRDISIVLFIIALFCSRVQAQDRLLEFVGGLVIESVIVIPTIGNNDQMIDIRHYSYGVIGAWAGVILTGKVILNKEGSISHALFGAIVGGIAGYVIGFTYTKGLYHIFTPIWIAFSLSMPPLGATTGYNYCKKKTSSALLNLHQGKFTIGLPNSSLKIMSLIEGNEQAVYQISLISLRW